MSNLKHCCRIMMSIKSPKTFRNRSRGLAMWANSLPKSGIFYILGPYSHTPASIEVKFCTAKRTHMPIGHAKFDVNRCNVSPLRGENLIFSLWVNLIPAVCALHNPAINELGRVQTIPGWKLTCSTNLFHHSLLEPTWTAFSDYTGTDFSAQRFSFLV